MTFHILYIVVERKMEDESILREIIFFFLHKIIKGKIFNLKEEKDAGERNRASESSFFFDWNLIKKKCVCRGEGGGRQKCGYNGGKIAKGKHCWRYITVE